jgi:hypothetical protein
MASGPTKSVAESLAARVADELLRQADGMRSGDADRLALLIQRLPLLPPRRAPYKPRKRP